MSDALDDVMDQEEDEEKSQEILNQVLDEIGINLSQQVCYRCNLCNNSLTQHSWLTPQCQLFPLHQQRRVK